MAFAGHAVGYGKGQRRIRISKAGAWKEGYEAGCADQKKSDKVTGGLLLPNRINPYKKEFRK